MRQVFSGSSVPTTPHCLARLGIKFAAPDQAHGGPEGRLLQWSPWGLGCHRVFYTLGLWVWYCDDMDAAHSLWNFGRVRSGTCRVRSIQRWGDATAEGGCPRLQLLRKRSREHPGKTLKAKSD